MRPPRTRAWRSWRVPVLSVAAMTVLVLLAGCGPDASTPAGASGTSGGAGGPFRGCPPSVPPTSGAANRAAPGPDAAMSRPATSLDSVPDLTLPCFVGGAPVALRALGQPTVINLWASWCDACQVELPQFQQLADSTGGQLLVLGVVSQDTADAAGSLATGLGITFPTLFDPSSHLQKALAQPVLPVTLFVDANGAVRHVDRSGALTLPELVDLVHQHLGLVVG